MTERGAAQILSLPMYPQLSDAAVDRVIARNPQVLRLSQLSVLMNQQHAAADQHDAGQLRPAERLVPQQCASTATIA